MITVVGKCNKILMFKKINNKNSGSKYLQKIKGLGEVICFIYDTKLYRKNLCLKQLYSA